jgi:hypothetical protein
MPWIRWLVTVLSPRMHWSVHVGFMLGKVALGQVLRCSPVSINPPWLSIRCDRLCGLVASVADYKYRGPGFDSRALLRIFLRGLGLERGPLSLMIG